VRRTLAVGTLAAVCLLLFAGSAYLTLWVGVRSEVVTVPEIVGLPLEEARRVAASAGLELERVAARPDPAVGEGRVLSQRPPSGARTKTGRTLRVTESTGPERERVPDLTGGSLRRAQIALTARGLHITTSARVPVEGVPAGQVVVQDPPVGFEQWPGAGTSLLLSSGPPARVYVMPDLAGRTLAAVRDWAAERGLRLGRVSRIRSPGVLPDAVVSQRPLAGYPLDPSLAVTLTVAEGGPNG
jgi:serine/threonine-protein kinase